MNSQPKQSYTELRRFMEQWQWIDPRSKQQVTGYVHPQTATHVDEGNCVCLSVNTLTHQRKVQFVASGEIRVVNDILVLEVDGTRFITH